MKKLKKCLQTLALYFDDLLFLAGGACFVRAAQMFGGQAAAYATAGVCLTVYALVIALSSRR
nr:MAG TPA: Protein of unknown function (DUF1056) [Caudoviricetes sp.]